MKKWMILAAAILVVLGIGFAVKGASDKKQGATPEGAAVPETTTNAPSEEAETANALREETETTETEDGAEEIDTLCGQITEINDEYLILEGTQQGTVQVNIFDDTLYNGSLQQGELAVGQYAEVIYGRRDDGGGRNRDLLHQRHGYHVHPGTDERHRRGEVSEN